MAEKSFTQVAVKNNQVVGIIIGDLKDQKSSFKNYIYYPVIAWYVTCLLVSEEGRNALSKYGIDINTINNTMIDKLGVDFDAELSLFMVAPEGQELGIGSTLYKYILNKLQKNIENFYLYTDTTCNYGFYEYKGLDRVSKKNVEAPINEEIDFFIYAGEIDKITI